MSMFNIFQKKNSSGLTAEPQDEKIEEYVVATFIPKKISMTSELLRRQREDEIRKKYCKPSIKNGVMM